MRVLFTCQAGAGHWYPFVPIARALAAAGHEGAFTANANLLATIGANGFRCFQAGASNEDLLQDLNMPDLSPLARRELLRRRFFPEVAPQRLLPDLVALQARWSPDLVVSENAEMVMNDN